MPLITLSKNWLTISDLPLEEVTGCGLSWNSVGRAPWSGPAHTGSVHLRRRIEVTDGHELAALDDQSLDLVGAEVLVAREAQRREQSGVERAAGLQRLRERCRRHGAVDLLHVLDDCIGFGTGGWGR